MVMLGIISLAIWLLTGLMQPAATPTRAVVPVASDAAYIAEREAAIWWRGQLKTVNGAVRAPRNVTQVVERTAAGWFVELRNMTPIAYLSREPDHVARYFPSAVISPDKLVIAKDGDVDIRVVTFSQTGDTVEIEVRQAAHAADIYDRRTLKAIEREARVPQMTYRATLRYDAPTQSWKYEQLNAHPAQ
jgi:hypothetical protein